MTVLAHVSHWYVSLPIFLGPVLVLLGWVYLGDWLDRRKDPPSRGAGGGDAD